MGRPSGLMSGSLVPPSVPPLRAWATWLDGLLELLLGDERLDVNPPAAPGGQTPLMLAVQWSPWAVPLLLRHGNIDITLADDQGRTALDHLVQKQASDTPLPGDVFEELERQLAAA